MSVLTQIILASGLISLGAIAGIFTIAMQEKKLQQALLFLVSLSAGALMGGAFLHLLPEAVEAAILPNPFVPVLAAFAGFFLIEKILHWRHCHKGHCEIHSFGYMNLFGDAVHNFIDGLILAATFMTDFRLGAVTTLAIALHEIPQEIGDFGVLLYSGFKKGQALIVNFLVALTVVAGGIVGYLLSARIDSLVAYLLPVAAGGFIYIAASDLMPEIRKEKNLAKSIFSFGVFLLGVIIMYAAALIES